MQHMISRQPVEIPFYLINQDEIRGRQTAEASFISSHSKNSAEAAATEQPRHVRAV